MTNAWVKDPSKVQDPRDFNVTEYENIDLTSGFTLKPTFKKLPFVQFWCCNKEYPQQSVKAPISLQIL